MTAEITSGQLLAQAQTGDVILFSRGGCNCFQQCVTGSVWVHVAMVVVSANGETRYAPTASSNCSPHLAVCIFPVH